MLIHFVHTGPAYMPELDAYASFAAALGHSTVLHRETASIPNDAQVVWWICGRVPQREARRLKHAFHIHEYASTSAPPHAWLKDVVKHWTQPRPDYRIFQNGWVRERMAFDDNVPHTLRDMGIAQAFFDVAPVSEAKPIASLHTPSTELTEPDTDTLAVVPPNEFDLVYLGEMNRLLPFVPLLQAISQAGRSLLLVGDVPDALRQQLGSNVTCTGRVPYAEVPHQLRRARIGLNLVGNVLPYSQQTSTKVLEYCAVGLPVVSNDYAWVRYFTTHYQGNFYVLRDDPSTWASSFGPALDAYPYVVPDVRSLSWPHVLAKMPIWDLLGQLALTTTK
jgi:glycosyltransferase involved in cell wall biosynthesis